MVEMVEQSEQNKTTDEFWSAERVGSSYFTSDCILIR